MSSPINIKIFARGASPRVDTPLLDIFVDDNSYRSRQIMGDDSLTLYYSLPTHTELPIGAFCIFEGQVYELVRPEALKMHHSRFFEYTVVMESAAAKAKLWKFRNPVDGRLAFSLTAKPQEHLQMLVDNLNRRDNGWTVAEDIIDSAEKVVTYDHSTCLEALQAMANAFETEFEISGKTVSLRKVEYNKSYPLSLSYGRGNGFKSGVGRTNFNDSPTVEFLLPKGSSQNINPSTYGSPELLLPVGENGTGQSISYDGTHFEDEAGYDPAKARTYTTEGDGRSLYRNGKVFQTYAEESLDCSEHYPKRVGEITDVIVVDAEKHLYNIVDITIPDTLNFRECLMPGETMTVIFQDGMLAGREFEVHDYIHTKTQAGQTTPVRCFELVPATIDGADMPNDTFKPAIGNHYIVSHIVMPDAYICDNATKSGASWDMFREAVKYMYDHEQQLFSFTGELDEIWAKANWSAIGAKIRLGGFIEFTDERFQSNPTLVRIISIKDYINNPHAPTIELSNATVSGGFSSTIKEIESQEVVVEDKHKEALAFTKRRFADAKETIQMLEAAFDNFSGAVNPVAVSTMQLLVGDESLQFRFVTNKTAPQIDGAFLPTYDPETKILSAPASILQHMTLGLRNISASHAVSEYRFWDMDAFESNPLTDTTKKYYLYAKAGRTTQQGEFVLVETPVGMEDDPEFYHLLVGIVNSEVENDRSIATLYGFSEVLPGRITTDKLVSTDGTSYFDLSQAQMQLGSRLKYNLNGDGKLHLQGVVVENMAGEEDVIGVFRGAYNPSASYYYGDEVTYWANGSTSTYRCAVNGPISGVPPTDVSMWVIVASGQKGETAVVYTLVPSTLVVRRDEDGSAVPFIVTCMRMKAEGNNPPVETTDFNLYYQRSADAQLQPYTNGAPITGAVEWVDFFLKNGDTIIAQQRVQVLEDAYAAKQVRDDLQYLQNALAGETITTSIGPGLVLANVIGVKDSSSGQVVAGMTDGSLNLSGTGEVSVPMLFAGASNASGMNTADFRVMPNGEVFAKNLTLYDGCKIGSIEVADGWLQAAGTGYSMGLSGAVINHKSTNSPIIVKDEGAPASNPYFYTSQSSESEIATYEAPSSAANQRRLAKFTIAVNNPTGKVLQYTNEALFLSAFGSAPYTRHYDNVASQYGNFAIMCEHGKFAGLRPNVRVLPANYQTTLKTTDHTIIVLGTAEITFPSNPEDGQQYFIMVTGKYSVQLKFGAITCTRFNSSSTSDANTHSHSDFRGIDIIVYSKQTGKWYMIPLE